jgi:hypothetical protein
MLKNFGVTSEFDAENFGHAALLTFLIELCDDFFSEAKFESTRNIAKMLAIAVAEEAQRDGNTNPARAILKLIALARIGYQGPDQLATYEDKRGSSFPSSKSVATFYEEIAIQHAQHLFLPIIARFEQHRYPTDASTIRSITTMLLKAVYRQLVNGIELPLGKLAASIAPNEPQRSALHLMLNISANATRYDLLGITLENLKSLVFEGSLSEELLLQTRPGEQADIDATIRLTGFVSESASWIWTDTLHALDCWMAQ